MSIGMESLSIPQGAMLTSIILVFSTAIYCSCCNTDSFKHWATPCFGWARSYCRTLSKAGSSFLLTSLICLFIFDGWEGLYLTAATSILALTVAYIGLELNLLDETDCSDAN